MVAAINNKKRFVSLAKSLTKGFTLIELLIVIAVFSILMVAVVGVFVSIVKIQRQTLAVQQLIDQTSYVMERVSRITRMAKADDGSCVNLGGQGNNYKKEISSLKFVDYSDNCRRFYLNGSQIYEKVNTTTDLPLTSNDIRITKFDFFVRQGGNKQPRVTIILEAEAANLTPSPKIKLQTTVSQRLLNISS